MLRGWFLVLSLCDSCSKHYVWKTLLFYMARKSGCICCIFWYSSLFYHPLLINIYIRRSMDRNEEGYRNWLLQKLSQNAAGVDCLSLGGDFSCCCQHNNRTREQSIHTNYTVEKFIYFVCSYTTLPFLSLSQFIFFTFNSYNILKSVCSKIQGKKLLQLRNKTLKNADLQRKFKSCSWFHGVIVHLSNISL